MWQIQYYCAGIDPEDCSEFKAALDELATLLSWAPLEVEIKVVPATREVGQLIANSNSNASSFETCTDEIGHRLPSRTSAVIRCSPGSLIAKLGKEVVGERFWGAAKTKEGVAAIWCFVDKYIAWHEVLHTLGASDCYSGSPEKAPTCGTENCIMQLQPTTETVGAWPFLCKTNVEKVRARCGNKEHPTTDQT